MERIVPSSCIGLTIKQIRLDDNKIYLLFTNNKTLTILNNGDCCADVYFSSDGDDLTYSDGKTFLGTSIT